MDNVLMIRHGRAGSDATRFPRPFQNPCSCDARVANFSRANEWASQLQEDNRPTPPAMR